MSSLVGIAAYGEGNAEILPPTYLAAMDWAPSSAISSCATLGAGDELEARLLVDLPSNATERIDSSEICVGFTLRSDRAHNWWFVA